MYYIFSRITGSLRLFKEKIQEFVYLLKLFIDLFI